MRPNHTLLRTDSSEKKHLSFRGSSRPALMFGEANKEMPKKSELQVSFRARLLTSKGLDQTVSKSKSPAFGR